MQGDVSLGVGPFLPVDLCSCDLGNNLAGCSVWCDASPLVVSHNPLNLQRFPEVFSACAVTRAMSCADTRVKTELTQHIAEQFDNRLSSAA